MTTNDPVDPAETWRVTIPRALFANPPAEDVTIDLPRYLLYRDAWVDMRALLERAGDADFSEADRALARAAAHQHARQVAARVAAETSALRETLGRAGDVTPEDVYHLIVDPDAREHPGA